MTTLKPITQRTMLVRLKIGAYGGEHKDKIITAEVHKRYGVDASQNAGYYKKKLLVEAVKHVQRRITAARNRIKFLTLPWDDAGFRIAPAKMYAKIQAEFDVLFRAIQTAIDEVVENWAGYLALDEVRLNGTYRAGDYPSPEQFRSLYQWRLRWRPVPDGDNWLIEMDADVVHSLQSVCRAEVEAEFELAARSLWERVFKAVSSMKSNLDRFGTAIADTTRTATFRDSVVTNLEDLVGILPALNILQDAKLDALVAQVEKDLCNYDATTLRQVQAARADTAKKAGKILDSMAAMMGPIQLDVGDTASPGGSLG